MGRLLKKPIKKKSEPETKAPRELNDQEFFKARLEASRAVAAFFKQLYDEFRRNGSK